METVVVLMSTYNGEKYIREQIDSILNQEDVNVYLLVRDDGSNDTTVDILHDYANRFNNVRYYTGNNLKSCRSFLNLLKEAPDASYYAFSDQDDVWLHKKLITAVNMMKQENSTAPLLYYSNLIIVDESLSQKGMYFSQAVFTTNKYSPLVENTCTGCTMVFNKQLRDLIAIDTEIDCTMHDAWMNMVCSLFGKCIYDNAGYILYRQHGSNVIGSSVRTNKWHTLLSRIRRLFNRDLQPRLNNATSLYVTYGDKLSKTDLEKIDLIINYKKDFISRLRLLVDKDVRPENTSKLRFAFHVILGTV